MIQEVITMYDATKIFNDRLPAVPVRGVIFLPNSDVRVEVGRDFSKNAVPILSKSPLEKIFMSNTIALKPEHKFSKLKEISIAPLIEKELKKLL